MKMKKKWMNVLSAATLTTALALTGCGSSGSPANSAAPSSGGSSSGDTLNIATVNNPDIVIMQKTAKDFEKETGVHVNFVVLPENDLRKM